MGHKNYTELERNNKTAMLAHTIDTMIMITFCFLQAVGDYNTWSYVLIVAFLGLTPIVAELLFWKKNHESPMIKHLVAIGFAIFYTYTLFTSFNNLVFAFVIPMVFVVSVYNDIRYIVMIDVGIVIESILVVIIGAKTGKLGYAGPDSAIIQIVVIFLVAIYSYITVKTLYENSKQKIEHIEESQNKTSLVLNDLSELSEKLKAGIEEIYTELEKLDTSSDITKETMQEVSSGASDTAAAVQEQLSQTESIQNKVALVDDAANQITSNMKHTLSILENGNQDIELLAQKVEASVKNGEDVAKKLNTLNGYIEEMNSIVNLIEDITSQTGLLALNASIEAARAGDAGKGFSVVASEISNMATQTSDATVHITKLITNVSASISEVVTVVYQMISGINEEKRSAENTVISFATIHSNTIAVRDNIKNLARNINELKTANQVIVDSIQTISAISEEVSAHASETMAAEEDNAAILHNISEKMHALIETIQ